MKSQTILNGLYQHIKKTDVLLKHTHVYYDNDIISYIHIGYDTDYMLSEFIVWDNYCYVMNAIDLIQDTDVLCENKTFKGLYTIIKKFDEFCYHIHALSKYQYLKPVKITWHPHKFISAQLPKARILYSQYTTEMTTWSLVYYFDKMPHHQGVISYGKVMFLMPDAPHELLKSNLVFAFNHGGHEYGICEIINSKI